MPTAAFSRSGPRPAAAALALWAVLSRGRDRLPPRAGAAGGPGRGAQRRGGAGDGGDRRLGGAAARRPPLPRQAGAVLRRGGGGDPRAWGFGAGGAPAVAARRPGHLDPRRRVRRPPLRHRRRLAGGARHADRPAHRGLRPDGDLRQPAHLLRHPRAGRLLPGGRRGAARRRAARVRRLDRPRLGGDGAGSAHQGADRAGGAAAGRHPLRSLAAGGEGGVAPARLGGAGGDRRAVDLGGVAAAAGVPPLRPGHRVVAPADHARAEAHRADLDLRAGAPRRRPALVGGGAVRRAAPGAGAGGGSRFRRPGRRRPAARIGPPASAAPTRGWSTCCSG